MDASLLMAHVAAYGADLDGIADRFAGNDELYKICFMDLLSEMNVTLLRQTMASKDYEKAFSAAHALKGVSGNLGLTAYYDAVCVLVESLRAKSYATVDEEYVEVERQFAMLASLADDAPPPSVEETGHVSAEVSAEIAAETPKKKDKTELRSRLIPVTAAVLVVLLVVLFSLFTALTRSYKDNVTTESASHLQEINYQINRSVEFNIESDWLLANTIATFLSEYGGEHDDESIMALLEDVGDTWDATDIALYTESGYSASISPLPEAKDVASKRAAMARSLGGYMTIVDSNITYTVPLYADLTYNGSAVVALSVVRDMGSYLDNMEFSSFGGTAYMYLTDDTGKVFSRLKSGDSKPVFNVMLLFDEPLVSAVTTEPVDASVILTAERSTVLISKGRYVVTTPINTRQNSFRLIYIVPQSAVNATMDKYTSSITVTSLIVLVIFAACAFVLVIYQYITRKRQFDSALLARERTFDLLVRNTRTAFALFKLNGEKPVYASENCERITFFRPALFKTDEGFHIKDVNGEDTLTLRELNEALREWDGVETFRSGFIENADTVPPCYFEVQLFPVDSEAGEYVGIAQDVTLLHAREETIKTALKLSERGSEAKTQFLSNMSHDIRTPMNAIVNLADFAIEEMDDPDKLREYLKTIRESSDHLLLLINDILEMSRIESGKTEIAEDPFDLPGELERIHNIIKPLCIEKRQTLLVDFTALKTQYVIGDRAKVSLILMNLLSNAIKFTPENGSVRFTVRELPSLRAEYAYVRFIVEDTGIGISKSAIEHIFEPFMRADEKRVSGIEGTGLGLSICRSYVTTMGGQIKCESETDEGSVFTVDLYFKKTDAPPDIRKDFTSRQVKPFAGKRALVCEDNIANRRIAVTMLERLGFTVSTAENGAEGVRLFRRSLPGTYDIIYMDIQMPLMDGYEAAVAIRGSEHTDARAIPIIAMTANVFMEDIEKAHIAGMDGHVGKPISTSAIANETNRVFSIKRRNGQ